MVWVYSYVIYITYLPLSFPFYWQQTTAHCSLHIAHFQLDIQPQKDFHGISSANRVRPQTSKNHLPPKQIPRRRPPGISHLQYHMQNWGPAPGKVSPGEAWRDRPLLKRRAPPRSSPSVGTLTGGSLQGLLLWRDSSQTGYHFPVSNSMKCNSGMGCQTTSAATSMVSRKVIISPFVTLAPYIEYIVCWISSNPFSEIR